MKQAREQSKARKQTKEAKQAKQAKEAKESKQAKEGKEAKQAKEAKQESKRCWKWIMASMTCLVSTTCTWRGIAVGGVLLGKFAFAFGSE